MSMDNIVYVTVSGYTASGKSAIAGEIEIALRAIGIQVEFEDGITERRLSGADYGSGLEMYQPRVVLREANYSRPAPPQTLQKP